MSIDLHPQATAILEAMAALGGPVIHESTPDEFRAYYATRAVPPSEKIHESRDISAGGVPARLYRPDASAVLPLLVYYHGGGWVIGGLDSHDNVCRSLANKAGVAVLSVDYRLAPEHPFPAAAEDALCALRWAHENAAEIGVDPDRIAVGGDSAGGNLAAVVAQQRPVPLRFQLLIYPAVDMTQSFASQKENAAGPVLTEQAMEWFIGHYMADRSRMKDELASPWFAADSMLKGTPPALVITAQFDPLRDEGEAYGARLIRNGTPASIVRFNGQFHSFFGMLGLLDDAESAHQISAAALRRALA